MTELLFLKDSYIKEFAANVLECVEGGVVLDQTAFYIGGGGQPYDQGILSTNETRYQVNRVSRKDSKVIHFIEGDQPAIGSNVHGLLDWDRRYRLMRTHTALHILSGIVWRDFGAKVTGGDMQPGTARMDFELEHISSSFSNEIYEKVNQEVKAGRSINVGFLSRDEAELEPDLIRTKINLLPSDITEIRTIDISGLDLQADGGTHVANTLEVGEISIVGHESKGRINKRLRISLQS